MANLYIYTNFSLSHTHVHTLIPTLVHTHHRYMLWGFFFSYLCIGIIFFHVLMQHSEKEYRRKIDYKLNSHFCNL